MKKRIGAILLCLLMVSVVPLSASAHSGANHKANHSVCIVKNCKKTGTHKHNGKTYAAHWAKDGHSYHNGKNRSGKHH